MPLEGLALRLGADVGALGHLLAFLRQEAYLRLTAAGDYELTATGDELRSTHPDGWHYVCLLWGGEHMHAWQHLDEAIRTGESSFERRYGCGYFDYLDRNPTLLIEYQRAMRAYALRDYAELPQVLDWAQHAAIMDVGGGYGAALECLQKAYPQLHYYLFDRQQVVDSAPALQGVEKLGGDFFEPLPQVADAILLCRVLHDWDDERALAILRRCKAALPANGRIYIVENEQSAYADGLHLLSLNMLAMCKSHERSAEAYRRLAAQAGLQWQSTHRLGQHRAIWAFA